MKNVFIQKGVRIYDEEGKNERKGSKRLKALEQEVTQNN